ncbi:2,3,4,5-tetrahydropyridine-2,6-dicarboxylate N-succinyltransferase [Pseudonocardia endophytica]|uniref:2,3,4,5-tetrahydropyridine-2,6-dicarboxylate N-succinyltransferase n=1 Tax=Pseudonocardia endophytica TaxID=401976 RepID=A0A4R1HPU8_PSEEN|nr:2,3,4,5-tetrahydropyridine-2,6-dicarboxylate N-succinyltransferase [Pseudonocardia endophytica]TCK24584.1 2,3,4,5-tetrahydropyridine-2,6-dicarboxylate N-succinyltransferase [Pseudonocardia endophytica]
MTAAATALLDEADELWERRDALPGTATERVRAMIELVDSGVARSARVDEAGDVVVDERVKRAILLAFRLFPMAESHAGEFRYVDRLPLKAPAAGVRIVPGGIVRWGAHLAPGVTVMPSFTNIGAFVDEGTMIDTWATVGSCAQIGKRVHLSGGSGIGGVLEPIGATPVVVEDDAFVGSRALVVEGARVRCGAKLGAGVVLTASTRVYDVETGEELPRGEAPAWSVCVSGTRIRSFPGGDFGMSCLLVVKRLAESERHDKTTLDEVFRAHR